MQTHLGADSPPLVLRTAFLFLVQECGTPSQKEIYGLLLRQKRENREFLHLLILNCIQLRIMLMPKQHILE